MSVPNRKAARITFVDLKDIIEKGNPQPGDYLAGLGPSTGSFTGIWDDPLASRYRLERCSPEQFAAYDQQNPQVYRLLERFALEAVRRGVRHLSISLLTERVRWYTTVETHGDSFKVNNSYRAFYARKLMQHPELQGVFETRTAKADRT